MPKPWRKRAVWAGAAVVLTALLVLVYANLTASSAKVEHAVPHRYAPSDAHFARVMGTLLGPGMLGGNKVTSLLNGEEVFPAMLAAIRGAQHTITFETYIYWSGEVGEQFAEALSTLRQHEWDYRGSHHATVRNKYIDAALEGLRQNEQKSGTTP